MRRATLPFVALGTALTLAGCSGGGTVVSNAGSTSGAAATRGAASFSTQSPGAYDSPGVVAANSAGRKVVLDDSLPVFDPPLTNGTVSQSDWPAAGRLLSIKELIEVFPDAYTISLTPDGPTKVQVGVELPGQTKKGTLDFTITAVGAQNSVLHAFDGDRSSDRSVYTDGSGKPSSGRVFYKDGAFKTQRLKLANRTWTTVIGNGTTAMQITVETDNLYGLEDDDSGFGSDGALETQVMPLIFQLLAARM